MIIATFKHLIDDSESHLLCDRITMTNCTYHVVNDGTVTHLNGYALIDVQAADEDTDKDIQIFNFMYGGIEK